MNRLIVPLIPAAIIGLVAHGTGFKVPDAVLIAIGVWSVFVVFSRMMNVTSTIVAVCLLGALSQVDWYGQGQARYASSELEASPGTFTHLARSVYRSVEDAVGIPHAPVTEVQVATAPLATPVAEPTSPPSAVVAVPPAAMAMPAPAAVPVTVALQATPISPTITVAGQPRVVDAATLSINGHLVHLAGVSVPTGAVDCWRNGRAADCGLMATERLSQLVGASRTNCVGTLQGSAIEARCSTAMVDDVAKAMLDQGWAVLSRSADVTYQQVASTARGNRRGLWAANFARADQIEPSFTTLRR